MNSVYNKTIHRFWAGSEMPDNYKAFGAEWKRLNPEWTVKDWGVEAVGQFPELREVFEDLQQRDAGRHGIEMYVQIADILGYALVERFGGIYANCDMQPVQPLPDLPVKAWASYENDTDGRIVNAIIGAPRHSDPFWWSLMKALPENYFAHRTAEMIDATGPAFLTKHAESRPRMLHVFPVDTFNPVHWSKISHGGDAQVWAEGMYWKGTETIAIHHWGHRKDGRTNTVENATQYRA